MPRLWVTTRDGNTRELQATAGTSLMLNLKRGGVDEILALCGGCASCGTCHVYIADGWSERLPVMNPEENIILGFSDWRRETSRLSCQIRVGDELDGMAITVAPED